MTIEVTILVSVISVCASVVFGILSHNRAKNKDTSDQAGTLSMILTKLESITNEFIRTNTNIEKVESEAKENRERIIKVEESTKQAHRRIDNINPEGARK